MSFRDEWPKMPDGKDYDGKDLLSLVRSGNSPFACVWDVELLIGEIEEHLDTKVVDIPIIYHGSNNYGFHLKLSDRPDVVARLARGDVNMPDFDGFPIHVQVLEVKFEVAVYELLRAEPAIMSSRLLYHRIPAQHPDPRLNLPRDISGRRLLVFERAEGENNVWDELDTEGKDYILTQTACIRAALFSIKLPPAFVATWLRERLFEQKPDSIPVPVASTRGFCVALIMSKIEATIGNVGDMIGWEDDGNVVGPVAAASKQALLRLVPHILPVDGNQTALYRFVLDHGDFGVHNLSTMVDSEGRPRVTSLFDWETGCIIPAILSDPLMAVTVDLVADEYAAPAVIRVDDDETPEERAKYMRWAEKYLKELYSFAQDYESVIRAGKDARHLWFALRDWRGEDPEGYFGRLGDWAERRLRELAVDSS